MSFLVTLRRAVLLLGIILVICLNPAAGKLSAQGTFPEAEQVEQLIQDTMLDFALAVKAKDFTGFHRNIIKAWQKQMTKEDFATVFQAFLDQHIDFTKLQDFEPVLTETPLINEDDVLVLQGYYPTQPPVIYFTLKYLEEDSAWKLAGIVITPEDEPRPENEEAASPAESEPVRPSQETTQWEKLHNEAISLFEQEQYSEALKRAQEALKVGREAFGTDHPNIADNLYNMGLFHYYLEQYTDAEAFYKQALEIWEKILEPEHPDVVTVLRELAFVYDLQGKYAEAEPLYQRALAITEKSLGADHLDVGYLLHDLARLYTLQEKYAEAEPLYQRALKIEEKALGSEHVDIGYLLHNLAFTYESQGKYAESERLYRRALAIKEKTLEPDDLELALTLSDLGELYNSLGKYIEAEPLHRRALLIRENALGSDHPEVAESLNHLGEWHDLQDRRIEAELLYRRALAIAEKVLEADDPVVVRISENLTNLYEKIGRKEESTEFTDTSESPLLRLLRFVPDTPEYRKYLTYGDADAWHTSWNIPRVDNLEELENLGQEPHAYWKFIMTTQTIPPGSLGIQYLFDEDQRSFYGFDLFNLDRFMEAGELPDRISLVEFSFDHAQIAKALTTLGYETMPLEKGVALYRILDDYKADLRFPTRTGRLGGLNRIILRDGQMIIAKATAPVTNALLAYNGEKSSLADSSDYVAAVKALEHSALKDTGELVGAIFMTAPNFSDPALLLEPSAHEEAIQQLKDYAQKPPLPPYSLVVFATRHTRGASFLILTVVFPKGTDANAAADILADRLQHYVSVSQGISLDDRWTFEKATGVEVQELPVVLAVMRVDDPPPTPQDAANINAGVFTWSSLIFKRDALFLIPGDIPELPEQ